MALILTEEEKIRLGEMMPEQGEVPLGTSPHVVAPAPEDPPPPERTLNIWEGQGITPPVLSPEELVLREKEKIQKWNENSQREASTLLSAGQGVFANLPNAWSEATEFRRNREGAIDAGILGDKGDIRYLEQQGLNMSEIINMTPEEIKKAVKVYGGGQFGEQMRGGNPVDTQPFGEKNALRRTTDTVGNILSEESQRILDPIAEWGGVTFASKDPKYEEGRFRWLWHSFLRSAPTSLSMRVPELIARSLGGGIPAVLATVLNTGLESSMEAGNSYRALRDRVGEAEAIRRASKQELGNQKFLSITNALQAMLTNSIVTIPILEAFSKHKGMNELFGTLAKHIPSTARKIFAITADAALEIPEEWVQKNLEDTAMGTTSTLEDKIMVGASGFTSGLFTSAATNMFSSVKSKALQQRLNNQVIDVVKNYWGPFIKTDMEVNGGTFEQAAERLGVGERAFNSENLEKTLAMTYRKAYLDARKDNDVKKAEEFVREFESARNAKVNGQPDDEPFQSGRLTPAQRKEYLGKRKSLEDLSIRRAAIELEPKKSYATPEMEQNRQRSLDNLDKKIAKLQSDLETLDQIGGTPRPVESLKEESGLRKEENDFTVNQRAAEVEAAKRRERHKKFYPEMTDEQIDLILANNKKVGDLQNELLRLDQTGEWSLGTATREEVKSMINRLQFETDGIYALNKKDPDAPLAVDTSPEGYAALNQEGAHELRNDSESPLLKADGADPLQGYDSRDGITLDELLAYPVAMGAVDWRKISVPPSVRAQVGKILLSHLKSYDQSILNNSVPAGVLETMYGQAFDILAEGSPKSFLQSGVSYGTQRKAFIERHKRSGLAKQTLLELHSKSQDNVSLGRTKRINDLQLEIDSMVNPADIARAMDEINELKQLNEDVKRSNIEDSTALEEYEQKQLQDEFDKQNEYKEGDLLDSRNQKPIKNAWEAHQDSEAELALARGETAPQNRTLMDYFMLSEKELSDLYRQYVGTGASRTIEDSNINKTPSDLMRAFKSFHERMSAQGMSDAEMTAIMENAVRRVTETLGEKLLANPDLTAEERKHRGTQEIEDLEGMVEKRRRISEFEVDALSLELGLSTSDIMTAIIYAEKHQGSPGQTMRLWLKSHPGILATPDPVTPIGNALLKTSFYRDRSDSIRTELMDVRSSVHTMAEDLSSMDKTSLEYLSKLREWHEAFEHLNELSAKMNSYDRSYVYGNYDLMKSIKEANGRDAGEFFLSEAGDVRGDVTRALMEKIPKRLVKDIRNAIAEGNEKTPGDQNKADLFVEAWENRQALKNERYPGVSEEILDRFNETVSSLRDKEGNPLPQYVGAEILFDMYHAYLDAGRGADPTDFRDGIPRGFLLELEKKYNEREQSARDGWTKQKGEVLSVYHDLDLSKVDSDGAALLEHYSFNDTDGSVELDPVSMGHVRERLSERIRDFREMNQNFEDWFSRRSEIMADPIVKDIPDIGEVISSTPENLLINWNRLSAKQKAEASVKLLSWDRMGDTNLQVKTDAAKIVLRTLDSFQQELETGKTPLEIVMNMYQDVYAKLEGDLRFRGDRDITTGMLEEKRIERGDLFTKQQLENTEILSRLRGQPFMSDMPLLTNAQIDTVLGFAHEGADTPVMESGEAVAGALKEMAPDPFFGEKASKSMGAVGQGLGFVPTTQRHPMSKQQAAESTGVMGQILSWVYDRKASRPHAFNNVWEPMYQWISGRETHLEKSVSSIKDKIDADKTGAVTEKSVASLLMHPTTTDISALYRGGLEAVKTEVETVRTVIGEIIAMRKAQGLKETFKGPGDFLRAIQRDSRVDARKNPNYIPDINKVQQFAVDALLKKDVKSIAEGVQLAHDIINGHVYGGVNIKMLPSHVKTLLEYIPDPSAQLYSGVRKFVRSTAREISENYLLNETAIASDVRRNPKDVQLVSTQETKYYSLEGKWVDPEVAKAMNQDKKAVNQLFKGVQLLNSIFKQGKIIYSTTSYVNNFFGNFALLQMGGVPLHYSITAYPQAAKDVIRWITTGEMTTEIKEAIDAGLFQGTMTKNMLAFSKSDLDTLTAATGFNGVNKILFKCVTGLESNRVGATGRTVYEGIEQIHRFIGYQYYRTHGANASTQDSSQGHGVATPLANLIFRNKIKLDPAAAAREVDQALFDYRDLPRGVKMLRDSFIPFVSFPFLAGRSYLRNSYHNPRGVASMVLTGVLLREGIRLLTGRELELEGWIPYWSTVDPLQRGNTRYGETAGSVGGEFQIGGPVGMVAEIQQGKSFFTGRNLVDVDNPTKLDYVIGAAKHVVETMAPAVYVSLLRNIQAVNKGSRGMGEAALRQFGIRTRPMNSDEVEKQVYIYELRKNNVRREYEQKEKSERYSTRELKALEEKADRKIGEYCIQQVQLYKDYEDWFNRYRFKKEE